MSARTSRMRRKALRLIDSGYTPTFRQLMQSYRFWRRIAKQGKFKVPKKYRELIKLPRERDRTPRG